MTDEVDFDQNATELYTAICAGEWENATIIAKEDPKQAKTWVVKHDPEDANSILWRFLPIHSACARQPSDSLIEALLLAYPGAASAKDDQGFLAIHYACGNRASDAVINMLLIINPQTAAVQDPFGGKLPLHHLSQWGCFSAGVVNMLLAVYPEAIHEKDYAGYTPIDLAKAANYPGRNVVISALKRCMVASKMRNSTNSVNDSEICQELESIQNQEDQISELTDKVDELRGETSKVQEELNDIRAINDKSLSHEKQKVMKLQEEHTSLQNEVNSCRNKYHQTELQHSQNLEDIQFCRKEILLLKDEKERTMKERDIIQEKLSMKTKTSEYTIRKLEARVDEQKIELQQKCETLETLEKMASTLEKEMERVNEESKEFNEELALLRDSKNVSEKMDKLNLSLVKLNSRYDSVQQMSVVKERLFKETLVEKEQKILEFAQLEEKIRSNTSEEHDNLLKELNDQHEELLHIVSLVKG